MPAAVALERLSSTAKLGLHEATIATYFPRESSSAPPPPPPSPPSPRSLLSTPSGLPSSILKLPRVRSDGETTVILPPWSKTSATPRALDSFEEPIEHARKDVRGKNKRVAEEKTMKVRNLSRLRIAKKMSPLSLAPEFPLCLWIFENPAETPPRFEPSNHFDANNKPYKISAALTTFSVSFSFASGYCRTRNSENQLKKFPEQQYPRVSNFISFQVSINQL